MAIINKNEYKNLDKQVADFQKNNKVHSHLIDIELIRQLIENTDGTHLKIQLSQDNNGEIVPIISTAKKEGEIFKTNTDMFLTSTVACPPGCERNTTFSDLA
jgi:hypothetical protein